MSSDDSDHEIKHVLERYNTPDLFESSDEDIQEPILRSQFERQSSQWRPSKESPRKPLMDRAEMTEIAKLVSGLSIESKSKSAPKINVNENKIRLDYVRCNKREKENGVDDLVLSPVRRSTRLTEGVAFPSQNATQLLEQGAYFKANPSLSIKGKVEWQHYIHTKSKERTRSLSPPSPPRLGSKVTLAKITPSKRVKERLGTDAAVSPVRRSNRLDTSLEEPLVLDDNTGYVPNPDDSVNIQWRNRSPLRHRK